MSPESPIPQRTIRLALRVSLMLFLPLWFIQPLSAQDIHFSQQDANPMLMNPAYTGFYEGTGRFGLLYRNQWVTVSVPFQTCAMTAEVSLHRNHSKMRGLNLGLTAYSDVAGSLHYGILSGHLSMSYYLALNQRRTQFLSFGVEGAFAQAGFNPDRAEMTDPSELFEKRQVVYPTFATGIAWYAQPHGDWQLKAGLAVHNLNRPNISYMKLDDTHLEPRYCLFARAEYRCWLAASLQPLLMVQLQRNYREIVYGLDVKWYLEESSHRQTSLSTGLAHRYGDALITHLTLEYNAFLFSFYYDANLSSLSKASHTLGAFELGLVYRLSRTKGIKSVKCPVF